MLFLWSGGLVQPGQHVPDVPERVTKQCVLTSTSPRGHLRANPTTPWPQLHRGIGHRVSLPSHTHTQGFGCYITVENSKVKLELLCVSQCACVFVSVWTSVRTQGGEKELDVLRIADASYKAEVISCSTHGWYSEKISHLAPGHRRKRGEERLQHNKKHTHAHDGLYVKHHHDNHITETLQSIRAGFTCIPCTIYLISCECV